MGLILLQFSLYKVFIAWKVLWWCIYFNLPCFHLAIKRIQSMYCLKGLLVCNTLYRWTGLNRTDVDPKFPSGLGKIRIMHKGINRRIQQARASRPVHFKNQDGILTHRLYISNPPYLPSFPNSPTTSPACLIVCPLRFFVGEDIISAFCGNDFGASYHVISNK